MILVFVGLYISFHLSCSMEQGDFLLSIDTNLNTILTEQKAEEGAQLLRETTMYSNGLTKVQKLFLKKRKVIMNSARTLLEYGSKAQLFFQKYNMSNVQTVYNLTDKQANYFNNTVDHIKLIWAEFMDTYENNKNFSYINSTFKRALIDDIDDRLTYMIQNPEPKAKRKVFLDIHYYFYSFGKLIKRFRLGRADAMPVAKRLYHSQSPTFLKFLDLNKFIRDFRCNAEEAAAVSKFLGRLKRRWTQFINACYQNIKFEHKADVTRVNIVIRLDKELLNLLKSPDPIHAKRLIQNIITLYNSLGYLRSKGQPDVLNAAKLQYGGNPLRFLSKPINLEAVRLAFKLTEAQWSTLVQLITGIRERFSELQRQYQSTQNMAKG